MKHDIDIFDTIPWQPRDYRWDTNKNAKLLNIVYHGGTFGSFLKYFIERFSTKTPDIDLDPFTESGTSHKIEKHHFSGLIQRYHQSFINDNIGETGLPVCLIIPSTEKHYLYLKKAQWFRGGDFKNSPDDLWGKPVGEMSEMLAAKAKEIAKLYDIRDMKHFSWLPKFIVRDWYKLEFLQSMEDTYSYQWFEKFKTHPFWGGQMVFHLDLETFFAWDTFVRNIMELDAKFDLAVDFGRKAEMREIFDRGLSLDTLRQECNLVEDVLANQSDLSLDGLGVAHEGFIYANIEKANPDIQMPLTNRFFRDYEEIKQYIKYFPNWYRRKNPNLG